MNENEAETTRLKAELLDKLAEDLYQRGRTKGRQHPEMNERQALAYAVSGHEWLWLEEYESITGAAKPEATS